MASTTLVTFLLETQHPTSTVHLLGSWDNFCKAYPMTRDLRIGRRYWRGCFSFSNIICDGEPAEELVCREGGLKMGGTYWYYYQLDSEVDYHNPCEPSTTSCPYLPGQVVNVLEVPMQDEADDSNKRPSTGSSSVDAKFTLNPEDKFLALKPSNSNAKAPRHARSTPTMGGFQSGSTDNSLCLPPRNLINASPSTVTLDLPATPQISVKSATCGRKTSPISAPMTRRPSLWNVFRRDSRSADETKLETHQAWQFHEHFNKFGNSRLSTRAGKVDESDTCDTMSTQGRPHELPLMSTRSPTDRPESRIGSAPLSLTSPQRHASELCKPAEQRGPTLRASKPDEVQAEPVDFTSTLRTQLNCLSIQPVGYTGDTTLSHGDEKLVESVCNPALKDSKSPVLQSPLHANPAPIQSPYIVSFDKEAHENHQNASTESSYASSHGFSPTWSSITFTDSFSPTQGGQVVSPTISDFGDCLAGFEGVTSFSAELYSSLKPPTAYARSKLTSHIETGESNVYQLPEADGSVLTLRDLSKAENKSRGPKSFGVKNGNDLIEAWNDGAQERVKTNFEEFFDDHSYLSTVIL